MGISGIKSPQFPGDFLSILYRISVLYFRVAFRVACVRKTYTYRDKIKPHMHKKYGYNAVFTSTCYIYNVF